MRLRKLSFHLVAALPFAVGIPADGGAQVPGQPFQALQQQIDAVKSRLNATEAELTPLQQQIDNVKSRVTATETGLSQEAESRRAADADLQAQIDRLGRSNTGSGADGSLTISTNTTIDRAFLAGISPNAGFELHLTDFSVDAGVTVVVDSIIIIRCTGAVNIHGDIVVNPVAPGGTVTVGGPFGAFLDAGGNGNGLGAGLGGTNSNAAGGGGGNAGRGGDGLFTGGGKPYPYRLQPWGSGGGAGQATSTAGAGGGGFGGGSLIIVAQGAINIGGFIVADGSSGGAAHNGGGGGSGGTIAIFSETGILAEGAPFRARGADGGNNAGGGGGGYIVLIAPSVVADVVAGHTAGGVGFRPGDTGKVVVRNEAPRFWAF